MHSRLFRLFGHTLSTAEDFSHSLQSAPDACEDSDSLRFIVKRQQPAPERLNASKIFPESPLPGRRPASLHIYTDEKILRIVYLDFAVYDIAGSTITCYPANQTTDKQVHLKFLGPIMSIWLEQNGFKVLHASAVLINQKAVLFLADSQQGKSTIASGMISQGYPLISDDLVPVKYHDNDGRFYVYPAYPVIKLWPDHFGRVFKDQDPALFMDKDLKKCRIRVDRINPGLFCQLPRPVSVIYQLCRHDGQTNITVQPLSDREATIRLVRYSFAAPVMIAMQWQAARLNSFASLCTTHIQMREIQYPSDTGKLELMTEQIVSDVNSISSQDGVSSPR